MIYMGGGWAAIQEFETDKVLAEAMFLNGKSIAEMMGVILGLSGLFLSIAVVLQKRVQVAIGHIGIVAGALVFITEITEDLVGLLGVSWLSLSSCRL